MNKNKFIKECKDSGKFDYYQMAEICEGFKQNLTMQQIKLYTNSEFEWKQMNEIRWSFKESGLTIEQVKVFANPEFSWKQMEQIRYGFVDGLTIKQVNLFAKPEFDSEQMYKIHKFIKENDITNMSTKTIRFLIGLNCI